MARTLLFIVLILLLLGALPTWPYSAQWGYYPSGGLGLVLIIVLILWLMGVIWLLAERFFVLPKVVKEEVNMPGKKDLRGASKKEQRQYEHIKKSAQKSGRYGKRAKEVAARTVMKRHKKKRRKKGK